MQKILSTAARYLRSSVAQPGMLIVFTVMPIVFSLFFGSLFSSQSGPATYPVAIVAGDESIFTNDIVADIDANPNLRVRWVTTDQARELVSKRVVYAAFLLPANLSDGVNTQSPVEIVVWREGQSNMFIALQQEIMKSVRRVVASAVIADVIADGESETYSQALVAFREDSIGVQIQTITKAEVKTISGIANVGLGMTIMFLMMSAVISTGVILEERQSGTWRRVLAAPVTRVQVLLGYLLGFLAVAFLQFIVLAVVQHFLFKINWGNLWLLLPFVLLFLTCAMALGLAIAGIVRTFQQQASVASLVMTASGMLSGIFWPVEIMPAFMQSIARAMPQYWAMQGFTNIMLRGDDITTLFLPGGILLGLTVVFLTLGVARVKFE
ncbi:MAG: ABC-2 type transporter [Bacillota bacterium]|nr:MAG: ABC-2 type transporter [Bacillota bacterium]MBS3950675.1 ABC transporter permease [Peptococcaceae bacterium]